MANGLFRAAICNDYATDALSHRTKAEKVTTCYAIACSRMGRGWFIQAMPRFEMPESLRGGIPVVSLRARARTNRR